MRLDVVKQVTGYTTKSDISDQPHFQNYRQQDRQLSHSGDERILDAFFRTLVADRQNNASDPVPSSWQSFYHHAFDRSVVREVLAGASTWSSLREWLERHQTFEIWGRTIDELWNMQAFRTSTISRFSDDQDSQIKIMSQRLSAGCLDASKPRDN